MALATTVVAALSLYNASPAACNDRVHAIGCETHRLTDLVCAQLTTWFEQILPAWHSRDPSESNNACVLNSVLSHACV